MHDCDLDLEFALLVGILFSAPRPEAAPNPPSPPPQVDASGAFGGTALGGTDIMTSFHGTIAILIARLLLFICCSIALSIARLLL